VRLYNCHMHVLFVEDDAQMRRIVRRGLVEQGHDVDSAGGYSQAVALAHEHRYDVMVFDVMLAGPSGLDLVRSLRGEGDRTAMLMLTARDAPSDIVAGLDAGADDYLTKPFAFKVLLARLRALSRRASAHGTELQAADVRLDAAARVVTRAGVPIALTKTEFTLLEHLMRNAGRVVTRQRLVDRLWADDAEVSANRLDAFVKSLRHKLDLNGHPPLIHTIRGIGHCLREEPEA
jgi:DNA-binding response OmpR family regulator